jgi:hypothetical protein
VEQVIDDRVAAVCPGTAITSGSELKVAMVYLTSLCTQALTVNQRGGGEGLARLDAFQFHALAAAFQPAKSPQPARMSIDDLAALDGRKAAVSTARSLSYGITRALDRDPHFRAPESKDATFAPPFA